MTASEAIETIKVAIAEVEWDYPMEYAVAFEVAISALEKQVPKKATPHRVEVPKIKIGHGYWGKGTTVYKCPCCGTFVSRIYKHCHHCGQALDWSETE